MLKNKPKVKEKVKHLVAEYKDIFITEGRTVGMVPDRMSHISNSNLLPIQRRWISSFKEMNGCGKE